MSLHWFQWVRALPREVIQNVDHHIWKEGATSKSLGFPVDWLKSKFPKPILMARGLESPRFGSQTPARAGVEVRCAPQFGSNMRRNDEVSRLRAGAQLQCLPPGSFLLELTLLLGFPPMHTALQRITPIFTNPMHGSFRVIGGLLPLLRILPSASNLTRRPL